MYDEKPKKKKVEDDSGTNSVFMFIGIGLVVCMLVAFIVIFILASTGPTIGNIFSNVIEGLATTTP